MFLGEIGDVLERESGFVQRQSKLGGKEFVQVMSLGCLENGKASLDTFVQVAKDLGFDISSSGFHQRLTMKAVDLLAQVCQVWMQRNAVSHVGQVLTSFAAVRIFDRSEIGLPAKLVQPSAVSWATQRGGAESAVGLRVSSRTDRGAGT